MMEKALIPALDAVYQKDQAHFANLKRRLGDLQRRIAELNTPSIHEQKEQRGIESDIIANKHREWREQESLKISRAIFELQPDLEAAKFKLKKSFGKLEALKAIIKDAQV